MYKIKGNKVHVADPAKSHIIYSKEEFFNGWHAGKNGESKNGIALLLEPTPQFYKTEDEGKNKLSFRILLRYLLAYKNLLGQLILGLVAASILELILPFLTQSIVDTGINTRNISFIYLVLIAELALFAGQTSVKFIQSWILLHINTRINISILSDFLIKLMKLPISFFDSKMAGDIMQRMGDHQRIQNFLTGPTLSTLFSFLNFFIFSFIIIMYDVKIFFVFFLGSILYIAWVLIFLRARKKLDYKRFDIASQNQSKVIQLIYGMQEIKMNNCEVSKRWEWERLQARLFKVSVKSLALTQYQQGGAFFFNQGKNIFITFYAALAVVHGQLTIGAMLAIQYIVGQMNGPLEQLIQFIQSTQDAMISLERLNEIHSMEEEDPPELPKINFLPQDKSFSLKQITFTYPGAGNEPALDDIDLYIPQGKTTAIVRVSRSGKTTLLKLLMKFYNPARENCRQIFKLSINLFFSLKPTYLPVIIWPRKKLFCMIWMI